LEDSEDDWGTANRGRIITAAWLRNQLRGLLEPSGAQDWWVGSPTQVHYSGYLRLQFTNAWKRYVPDTATVDSSSSTSQKPSGVQGVPGGPGVNSQNSAGYEDIVATPDAAVAESIGCSNDDDKSQDLSQFTPGPPGTPGTPDGLEVGGNIKKPAKRETKQEHSTTTDGSITELPANDEPAADGGIPDVAGMIAKARAAYPTRSIKWLAKHVGLPVDVVSIYLGDDAA
jgi:hypothetical protein